jgi:hypothetical protein
VAYLLSTLVDRVLRKTRKLDQIEILAADIGSVGPSLTYTGLLGDLAIGQIVAMETELLFITAVNTTTKVATVTRGWEGTPQAARTTGQVLYIDPRLERRDVIDLVNNFLVEAYPRLYQVVRQELTYDSNLIGYSLGSDCDKVLRVDAEVDTTSKEWTPVGDWRFLDNMGSNFTNGRALILKASQNNGAKINVVYRKPFVKVSAETNDLEAVAGLAPYMVDLPYYFVMSRIMAEEEQIRSESKTASSHQRAQDVPEFASLQTADWYRRRYEELMESCRARLKDLVEGRAWLSGFGD